MKQQNNFFIIKHNILQGITEEGKTQSSLTIPDGVVMINYCAFDGCTNLTKIFIPESVNRIGYCAFAYTSLKKVTIPRNVMYIDGSAFIGCENLESVFFEKGSRLEVIGNNAFENCLSLKKINIPDKTILIRWYAFQNCPVLTKLNDLNKDNKWSWYED